MHEFWQAIAAHIEKNWEAYSAVAGAIVLASIACMPASPPKSFADLWIWARNALQTAIPAARQVNHENPTTAATAPQEKK
jgi:hypothetical protein